MLIRTHGSIDLWILTKLLAFMRMFLYGLTRLKMTPMKFPLDTSLEDGKKEKSKPSKPIIRFVE